jgi:uncharacterized membrane protein
VISFWTLVKWLHVVGAVIWLGGVFFVVFMLRPTLAKLPDPATRRLVLSGASDRMRRIINPVITLQVLTGTYMAWRLLGGWDELFTSTWGRVLLIKVILATLMIGLYVVVPRLLLSGPAQAPGGGDCPTMQTGPSLRQKAGSLLHVAMLVLGGLIILLAKILTH